MDDELQEHLRYPPQIVYATQLLMDANLAIANEMSSLMEVKIHGVIRKSSPLG